MAGGRGRAGQEGEKGSVSPLKAAGMKEAPPGLRLVLSAAGLLLFLPEGRVGALGRPGGGKEGRKAWGRCSAGRCLPVGQGRGRGLRWSRQPAWPAAAAASFLQRAQKGLGGPSRRSAGPWLPPAARGRLLYCCLGFPRGDPPPGFRGRPNGLQIWRSRAPQSLPHAGASRPGGSGGRRVWARRGPCSGTPKPPCKAPSPKSGTISTSLFFF